MHTIKELNEKKRSNLKHTGKELNLDIESTLPKHKKGNHSLVYQINEAILHFAKVQAIKILTTALRQ